LINVDLAQTLATEQAALMLESNKLDALLAAEKTAELGIREEEAAIVL